jgi:flagellar biosynthesis protein FliR
MLRLSAFLAFTSIFSIRAVNLRIRMCLGFALAFFVSQQIDIPRIDPLTAEGLQEIFRQILIGLTMGLVFQVASATLVVAGQAISGSMGLSMANMIDPNMGSVPCPVSVVQHHGHFDISGHWWPFDCVWLGAGVIQVVTYWPRVFLARHVG